MSSVVVRTAITNFITSQFPLEKIVDLTAEHEELKDLLARNGITGQTVWIGLQFIGYSEEPITIPATNDVGKYRELGAVFIHLVDRTRIGVGAAILPRAEAIRNAFRGQRIGTILVESVSPPNFESGATLDFEGGYTSASVIVTYQNDLDL